MNALGRVSGLVRFGVIVLAGVLVVATLVVGQDFGPAPIVLREGEAAPQTIIAPSAVSVVDVEATATERDRVAALVADVYRTDTQVTETVLDAVADVFATFGLAAEPLAPPETTTTTGATTTSTETTTTGGSETTEGSTTTVETTTTTVPAEPLPRTEQILLVQEAYPLLDDQTIATLVDLINGDIDRVAAGENALFPLVRQEAIDIAEEFLLEGIRSTELGAVRSELVTVPRPLVLLPDDVRPLAEAALADVVQQSLQANEFRDDGATQLARLEARDAVADLTVDFVAGEHIVRQGDRLTAVQLQAIEDLGLLETGDEGTPVRALALVALLVVALTATFVARLATDLWRRPKMVGLFGLLLVLTALASRVPELVSRDRIELGFLLPAALFGYLAATLFDARVAVLMALPVLAFVALATGDLALVVFSAAATLTPIPLVSSVASRAQLNLAVVFSALLHLPLAGAIAWFFYGSETVVVSAIWGGVGGIASGVVALGVLPVLASVFGITTTQTLLDLTDRNHPALRRIEETAPGTFNHSILVGNLADRASRAVGANPLLARAMAYYHDLGKTVQPKYFVENQFGVTNPHDRLPPEESAAIIRSHVAEGLRLAREYRIPPDVAQGILTHHGTSLMRYFSHKGEETYGRGVDPTDYRHRGRKPKSKEMVIIMLADATEAGTRALVQSEDPTSESIRELVESIIAEKVEDGQLEESDVTFGELTRIKEAFVDSMIGYYHTRIPYPGFPVTRSNQPA
ncbi:MAG: HDIG domain-containing metalloprotein [Actinomycetota bacterium]